MEMAARTESFRAGSFSGEWMGGMDCMRLLKNVYDSNPLRPPQFDPGDDVSTAPNKSMRRNNVLAVISLIFRSCLFVSMSTLLTNGIDKALKARPSEAQDAHEIMNRRSVTS